MLMDSASAYRRRPRGGRDTERPATACPPFPRGWLRPGARIAMTGLAGLLAAIAILWLGMTHARGQGLVADLSEHLIGITTGFTGTDVVLFGSVEEAGTVAVVVMGPRREMTVRRKDRVLGIWMNRADMTFTNAPTYYSVATNAPIEDLAPDSVLTRHQIGLPFLQMQSAAGQDTGATADAIPEFRSALIRYKQREGLYGLDVNQVAFLGDRLFRTNVHFPANVPTGLYTVSVYLIQDGDVVSAQTTPLAVSKVGLSAAIFRFARDQAFSYGLLAVIGAIAAGWGASAMFRKV